jgi:hypothetical protein
MENLSNEDLKKLSREVSKILGESFENKIRKNNLEKAEFTESIIDAVKKKDPNNIYTWLKHPLFLIVAGFLFTGILGGVLNHYIQQLQSNKEVEKIEFNEKLKAKLESTSTFSKKIFTLLAFASEFREIYRPIFSKMDTLKISNNLDDLLKENLNSTFSSFRKARLTYLENVNHTKAKFDYFFNNNDIINQNIKALNNTLITEISVTVKTLNNNYNSIENIAENKTFIKNRLYLPLDSLIRKARTHSNNIVELALKKTYQPIDNDNLSMRPILFIVFIFSFTAFFILALILIITKKIIIWLEN